MGIVRGFKKGRWRRRRTGDGRIQNQGADVGASWGLVAAICQDDYRFELDRLICGPAGNDYGSARYRLRMAGQQDSRYAQLQGGEQGGGGGKTDDI